MAGAVRFPGLVQSRVLVVGPVDAGERRQYRRLVRAVWRTSHLRRPVPAARPALGRCCCSVRPMFSAAPSGRFCRAPTFSGSACSTPGCRASSVGRSVATVAEIAFVAQWAILLHQLGTMTGAETTVNAAWVIVPLILIAECLSWYAVLTRNYLGNAIENSLWAVAFFTHRRRSLPPAAGIPWSRFAWCWPSPSQALRASLAFLMTIDVPMYLNRWRTGRCRRRQAPDASRGPARRQHALGGDARPCRVEGRDCLDVALFQPGGVVQPRAVRLLFTRGATAALSHRSDGRKPVAGNAGGRQATADPGAPQLLGRQAGGFRRRSVHHARGEVFLSATALPEGSISSCAPPSVHRRWLA